MSYYACYEILGNALFDVTRALNDLPPRFALRG
jgi:hypothetical protein